MNPQKFGRLHGQDATHTVHRNAHTRTNSAHVSAHTPLTMPSLHSDLEKALNSTVVDIMSALDSKQLSAAANTDVIKKTFEFVNDLVIKRVKATQQSRSESAATSQASSLLAPETVLSDGESSEVESTTVPVPKAPPAAAAVAAVVALVPKAPLAAVAAPAEEPALLASIVSMLVKPSTKSVLYKQAGFINHDEAKTHPVLMEKLRRVIDNTSGTNICGAHGKPIYEWTLEQLSVKMQDGKNEGSMKRLALILNLVTVAEAGADQAPNFKLLLATYILSPPVA